MNDKLERIKSLYYEHGNVVPDHFKWLIEQAEKAEQLHKENYELNKEIGEYSSIVLSLANEKGNISGKLEKLATKMLECE